MSDTVTAETTHETGERDYFERITAENDQLKKRIFENDQLYQAKLMSMEKQLYALQNSRKINRVNGGRSNQSKQRQGVWKPKTLFEKLLVKVVGNTTAKMGRVLLKIDELSRRNKSHVRESIEKSKSQNVKKNTSVAEKKNDATTALRMHFLKQLKEKFSNYRKDQFQQRGYDETLPIQTKPEQAVVLDRIETPEERKKKVIEFCDESKRNRHDIACTLDKNSPDFLYEHLSKDADPQIRQLIAENKHCPIEVQMSVIKEETFSQNQVLVQNLSKNLSSKHELYFRQLAGHSDEKIREIVASHKHAPVELLAHMSIKDKSENIRQTAATNFSQSKHSIELKQATVQKLVYAKAITEKEAGSIMPVSTTLEQPRVQKEAIVENSVEKDMMAEINSIVDQKQNHQHGASKKKEMAMRDGGESIFDPKRKEQGYQK
ncbi:hypothetical protein [Sulfuricurvum sp.]|uniref:hypothetical protein n=1 Tax=Sulfuricurvum sp. TaxID=2025608 RepID=UPI003BB6B006